MRVQVELVRHQLDALRYPSIAAHLEVFANKSPLSSRYVLNQRLKAVLDVALPNQSVKENAYDATLDQLRETQEKRSVSPYREALESLDAFPSNVPVLRSSTFEDITSKLHTRIQPCVRNQGDKKAPLGVPSVNYAKYLTDWIAFLLDLKPIMATSNKAAQSVYPAFEQYCDRHIEAFRETAQSEKIIVTPALMRLFTGNTFTNVDGQLQGMVNMSDKICVVKLPNGEVVSAPPMGRKGSITGNSLEASRLAEFAYHEKDRDVSMGIMKSVLSNPQYFNQTALQKGSPILLLTATPIDFPAIIEEARQLWEGIFDHRHAAELSTVLVDALLNAPTDIYALTVQVVPVDTGNVSSDGIVLHPTRMQVTTPKGVMSMALSVADIEARPDDIKERFLFVEDPADPQGSHLWVILNNTIHEMENISKTEGLNRSPGIYKKTPKGMIEFRELYPLGRSLHQNRIFTNRKIAEVMFDVLQPALLNIDMLATENTTYMLRVNELERVVRELKEDKTRRDRALDIKDREVDLKEREVDIKEIDARFKGHIALQTLSHSIRDAMYRVVVEVGGKGGSGSGLMSTLAGIASVGGAPLSILISSMSAYLDVLNKDEKEAFAIAMHKAESDNLNALAVWMDSEYTAMRVKRECEEQSIHGAPEPKVPVAEPVVEISADPEVEISAEPVVPPVDEPTPEVKASPSDKTVPPPVAPTTSVKNVVKAVVAGVCVASLGLYFGLSYLVATGILLPAVGVLFA